VKGNPAPHSASIQNYEQISRGLYHPSQVKFIAPTPFGADAAFASLVAVGVNNNWAGWDLDAQAYKATQKVGAIPVGGLSILGIPIGATAYPITGTTFAYVYSCYANAAATSNLTDWLAWLLAGSVPVLRPYNTGLAPLPSRSNPEYDKNVGAILANNGFHTLHSILARSLLTEYIIPSANGGTVRAIAAFVPGGPQVDGCVGVTGGGAT
jgi:hypothetical protein